MVARTYIILFFTIAMLIAIIVPEKIFSQNSQPQKIDTSASHNQKPDTTSDNSAVKAKVIYSARDSIRFEVEKQKVYLYGDAKVNYEDMEIKAGYIEFDMENNITYARGARDSSGKPIIDTAGMAVGNPIFKEGEKSFTSKEMTYNFKTKKGKIREIITQEGEGIIHAKDAKKDTGDVYYVKNGKYTTCDLEYPHFYLDATKLKVIPNDKIVCGPAYLVIADIPTPLCLPFGVFPNKKGRKSGVLIPSYGQSDLGYFLKDGGYYFGLSDYMDLALRGDIYSFGSWGMRANTNYNNRYEYAGSLNLSFAQIKISEKEFPDYSVNKDFFVRWQHAQDPKANPTFHFSANVNAGSSKYNALNSYNPTDILSNTFQSNISMNKSWQGSPFNLSVNMAHSQNTILKTADVTLPEATFTMARIYPMKRREQIGRPKWYEKIGLNASLSAKNQLHIDSVLFKNPDFVSKAVSQMQNGLKASVPISTSFNAGPFIFTPSVSMDGYGYFQSIKQHYNPDSARIYTDTLRQFKTSYDYTLALSMSTKIYGMFAFKHGRIKAIRHVMTPSISYSYRPDFSQANYGFYGTVQTTPVNLSTTQETYSYFQNGIYGYPPSGKFGSLNFSLTNNLEMKVRPSKKDTSSKDKKVSLLDFFTISTSYNLAVDSFNWSPINFSGRTKVFKKIDLTMNAVLDQYVYNDALNRRVNYFEFQEDGKLGRLTDASLSISTSLRSLANLPAPKQKPIGIQSGAYTYDQLNYVLTHPDYYVDFKIPWNLSVYYNVVYSKPGKRDTVIQSLSFNGDVNVTKKWKVGFHSGFDFVQKNFTFTSFDVYRDLHCWEMRLNWIPFGARKSYILTIAVKASALQDLKLMRKRDWYDYN